MEDFSSGRDLFFSGSSESASGLRYRGNNQCLAVAQKTSFVYSDESGLSAAIEFVSDGSGSESVPVFVTKAGNKVYIPPSIADLLRDKPPDIAGDEGEDEEGLGDSNMVRIDGISDSEYDSDFNDSNDDILRLSRGQGCDENGNDSGVDNEDELGGIKVVAKKMKKKRRPKRPAYYEEEDDDDLFNLAWLSDFWEQFKYVGPRLLPFLKTLGLYFVVFIPEERPSLFAMMIKCLPIISLALFIVLHGIGLSEEHKFSRRILTGLIFSCLGDAFLIWPSYFLHGMAAFGLAQSFYIQAFGFQPLNWKLGLSVYTLTSSSLILILPGLMSDAMPIMIGVLVYSMLLTTMLWRAIDRFEPFSDTPFSWSKLSSCMGAIFFAISDTILALNQFYTRIPYHQTLVMTTYYLAQLGIALSVVSTTKEKTGASNEAAPNNLTDPVDNELSKADSDSMRLRKGKSVI